MKRTNYLFAKLLWVFLLILGNSNLNAQSKPTQIETVSGKPIVVSSLDQHIEKAMDSLGIPGLSIAMINHSEIVYHKAFGVANMETQEPVTKNTIFEAASLSKPLFAYFMMKMVEEDLIDLDAPILPYLKQAMPEEAMAQVLDAKAMENYKLITPRLVLSHGTGIPNWPKGPIHFEFEPGTGFSYSGEAYQHLAAAFGTKLGIGWGGALDSLFLEKVAKPLGMKSSSYTWNDRIEENKATGHQKGKVNLEDHKYKKVGPGYSLHSEALDYAHFLVELMAPQHLSKLSIDEMLREQNHFKLDNELFLETGQTGWGLGFAQKPTPNGLMHLHTGNNHDFQAYAMFVPDRKYGFVMFANSDNLYPFLQELEKLIEKQF
ncbi:MAG: serine hydrolase domain-containing protein [Bacteroidota bacterium]